ncbi:hypothetical protein LX59_01208 [Azomonas agilis]|uniref:Uncharacterized protein n=1 Tax=Azomonas agilis TaxID=116849 RepID=A0A562J0G3_9GAMM|nr:hypothetical protein [Azomonas agilis]TWH76285.1 hypothetical protein LX59_01208 [Azomonas agilis]
MSIAHYWHQLKSWRYTRILLGSILVSIVAYALVSLFPLLSLLQGVVLALLGILALNSLWKSPCTTPTPETPVRPGILVPFALLGAVVLGAVWGALSATSLHSVIAGGVILALAALIWRWYAVVDHRQMSARWAWFCILSAFVAYLVACLWHSH